MDVLTFSQVLFNTLASMAIIILMVVLALILYCIMKFAMWMRRMEQKVSRSSERISHFFGAVKEAFIIPIIERIFKSEKKRKK